MLGRRSGGRDGPELSAISLPADGDRLASGPKGFGICSAGIADAGWSRLGSLDRIAGLAGGGRSRLGGIDRLLSTSARLESEDSVRGSEVGEPGLSDTWLDPASLFR